MFSRLPESNATRQRRTGGFVVSTAVHAVVIALAVRATMLTAAPPPKVTPLEDVIYTKPTQETPPASPRAPAPRTASENPTPTIPTLPDVPSPDISDVVPHTLPDVDAVSRHVAGDFGKPTRVSGPESSGGPPNVAGDAPLPEWVVDKVVVALPGTGTPRYPDMLRQAGVEGDVHAQFVVDTLGRVEPGSVRVLDATHDQFAAAVRTALARARFKPAEAGGHRVRQLAEQTFTFRLGAKD
jgi:protein TonB